MYYRAQQKTLQPSFNSWQLPAPPPPLSFTLMQVLPHDFFDPSQTCFLLPWMFSSTNLVTAHHLQTVLHTASGEITVGRQSQCSTRFLAGASSCQISAD
jgi:hypothetical protein